jgi:branched-chain amino acid transport system permease protein
MSNPSQMAQAHPSQKPVWVLALVLALVPAVSLWSGHTHWIPLLTQIMIFALAALSLDLVLGIGGLVSFGHAAFIGLGAYTTGILVKEGMGDTVLALPSSMLVCALFAYLTGLVALKTRGVVFIMITLAFSQMVFFATQSLYRYGGDDGLTLPMRAPFLGQPLFANKIVFYYFTWACLLLCLAGLTRLVQSRFGRVLLGARDNEIRMAALGYDVFQIRLAAYTLSGMIAGLAGFLIANQTEFVSPAYASWQRSGDLIFMVILGGVGSLWGAVAGAFAFLLLEEGLSGLTEHWKVIFGPMIILFVLFSRGGLARLHDLLPSPQKGERPHG